MAITKFDLANAMRCQKRAWLFKHAKEKAEPPSPGDVARMLTGQDVGKLARQLYSDGYHIKSPTYEFEKAVAETNSAFSESYPSLFEPAFQQNNCRIRVDILLRLSSGWEIIEVKSSSYDINKPEVKKEHLYDVAFQVLIAKNAGIDVITYSLLLLNKNYIYNGNLLDLNQLFIKVDITNAVSEILDDCQFNMDTLRTILEQNEVPDISIGLQCKNPTCDFLRYCSNGGVPNDHLLNLPYAGRYYYNLWNSGVKTISAIPANTKLDGRSRLAVKAHQANSRIVENGMREFLESFRFPVAYLDFEAFQPAVPVYDGTSPYQVIPFQFSLHMKQKDGSCEHFEFIHEDSTDPRPNLISKLHSLLMQASTIVTYSGYEKARLKDLANQFGGIATEMFDHFADREADLCRALKSFVGDPAFAGSYSIKNVLPILAPSLTYDGLSINSGEIAAIAYSEMISQNTSTQRKEQIKNDLLAYCKLDTWAMVILHEALLKELSP